MEDKNRVKAPTIPKRYMDDYYNLRNLIGSSNFFNKWYDEEKNLHFVSYNEPKIDEPLTLQITSAIQKFKNYLNENLIDDEVRRIIIQNIIYSINFNEKFIVLKIARNDHEVIIEIAESEGLKTQGEFEQEHILKYIKKFSSSTQDSIKYLKDLNQTLIKELTILYQSTLPNIQQTNDYIDINYGQKDYEGSDIKLKIKKHFNFFNESCPRKHRKILKDKDFDKLIKWTEYYFLNGLKVPEIKEPIEVVNTNKTYVQLAFKYLFKLLHKSSPYPDSLFEFYKSAFSPYSEDKRNNFEAVKNNDDVKKLMQIDY